MASSASLAALRMRACGSLPRSSSGGASNTATSGGKKVGVDLRELQRAPPSHSNMRPQPMLPPDAIRPLPVNRQRPPCHALVCSFTRSLYAFRCSRNSVEPLDATCLIVSSVLSRASRSVCDELSLAAGGGWWRREGGGGGPRCWRGLLRLRGPTTRSKRAPSSLSVPAALTRQRRRHLARCRLAVVASVRHPCEFRVNSDLQG
jgi:hypothetical protein